MFTDKEHRGPFEFSEEFGHLSVGEETEDNATHTTRYEANDNDLLLSTSEKEENQMLVDNASAYGAPDYASLTLVSHETITSAPTSLPDASLTLGSGIDDLLGLGLPSVPTSPPLPHPLKLHGKPTLDPRTFQKKWGELPISLSQVCSITFYLCVTFYFFSLFTVSKCQADEMA